MALTPASAFIKKLQEVPPVFEHQDEIFAHFAEKAIQHSIKTGAKTLSTLGMMLHVNAAYIDHIDTFAPFYEVMHQVDYDWRLEALAERVEEPFELFAQGIAAIEFGGYKVLSIKSEISKVTLEKRQPLEYQDYQVQVTVVFAPVKTDFE